MDGRSISIFHYHVQPGGVTTVISLSVQAIAEGLPQIDRIDLVVGRTDGAEAFVRKLTRAVGEEGPHIALHVHPALDYSTDFGDADAATTAEEIYSRYAGSTWWIHNYHLGKNPAFTQALLLIARDHPDQRMILHIHDFPECARYENLRLLAEHTDLPVYPVARNVRYALINERDRRLLTHAGIPAQYATLLTNPVGGVPLDRSDARSTKGRLSKEFASDFPEFDPSAPVVLSPVRTIRRKNILESALIAQAANRPVNFVVTLPGVSAPERPYSDVVESAFRGALIRGLWGIGERIEEAGVGFGELVASADLIATASIQEGFGFLYVEALLWGLPLFARRIDVIEGVVDFLDRGSVGLYDSFRVPLSADARRGLRKRYAERIARHADYVDVETRDALERSARVVLAGECVDFSYLDVGRQYAALERVNRSAAYRGEIRAENEALFARFDDLIENSASASPVAPDRRFTFRAFADTTRSIIDSFGVEAPDPGEDVQANLIRAFARIEHFRLLYE